MTWRVGSVLGVLVSAVALLSLVACAPAQTAVKTSDLASTGVTSGQPAGAAASATVVWGEVPKQCA